MARPRRQSPTGVCVGETWAPVFVLGEGGGEAHSPHYICLRLLFCTEMLAKGNFLS